MPKQLYTPPEEKDFEQVEPPQIEPVTEVAIESARIPNTDTASANLFKNQIDRFVEILDGKLSSQNPGQEQIIFMDTLGNLLKQDYPVFVDVMDYLVSKINTRPKAFTMDRVFMHIGSKDVQTTKTLSVINRYMAYMTATMTLAKNIRQRGRVGNLVDIPTLTKGLFPKAVKNIQTYFNKTYS